MRKIIIGRGHDCDVIIEDTTDVVSRRQAAITFDFMGRMTLYDLSTNGTYVNGIRVPKPNGVPIKYSDQINFGSVCDFNLKSVRDPYRNLRVTLYILAAVLVIGITAGCVYFFRQGDTQNPEIETEDIVVVEQTDTLNNVDAAPELEETNPVVENKSHVIEKKKTIPNLETIKKLKQKKEEENKEQKSENENPISTDEFVSEKNV